eukprot:7029222-Prorocentrum_lima.AAC.2
MARHTASSPRVMKSRPCRSPSSSAGCCPAAVGPWGPSGPARDLSLVRLEGACPPEPLEVPVTPSMGAASPASAGGAGVAAGVPATPGACVAAGVPATPVASSATWPPTRGGGACG